jgi:hypothetical protein
MSNLQPPFGYDRVRTLRKKVDKRLGYHGFGTLTKQQEAQLERAAEFSDFKRVENERQLETLKTYLAGFIYNRKEQFDKMMAATKYYLEAMDIQNKMWGTYTMTHRSVRLDEYTSEPPDEPPTTRIDIKAVVLELQKIAKGEPVTDNGVKQIKDAE